MRHRVFIVVRCVLGPLLSIFLKRAYPPYRNNSGEEIYPLDWVFGRVLLLDVCLHEEEKIKMICRFASSPFLTYFCLSGTARSKSYSV